MRETQAALAFLSSRAGMGGCGQREANLTFPSSSLSRVPPQRNSNGASDCDRTRDDLQGGHQLRPLQNHLSDVRLWEQGHFLLRSCRGAFTVQDPQARPGQTPSSHLRDPFPDEQGPAPEVCSVFDHGTPHRGAAHRPKVG